MPRERFLYRYPKDKIAVNALLIYPNSYSIGMSNLGFQWVYHLLQSEPKIHCERAFYEKGKPIQSFESSRDYLAFDVLFFSFSFETDILHLMEMLSQSRIEKCANKRTSPLIVVGGIVTTFLSYYLKEIADIVVSGDASLTLPPIIEAILSQTTREARLRRLEGALGVYPHYVIQDTYLEYSRDERNTTEAIHTVILSDQTEFADRGLIQTSTSCLYRCAFCLVGCVYGKYSPTPMEKILEVAERYKPHTHKVGLVAATLTNHPQFKEIIQELNRYGFQISFSAFRIEGLDDELLQLIMDNEHKTLVIAPETASDKLKKQIRKSIPNELIHATVRKAVNFGVKRIKLYFLIGLRDENEQDIEENIRLVTEIRSISMEKAKEFGFIPEIIVDINPLVPKPLTDFDGYEMEDTRSIKAKLKQIKSRLKPLGKITVTGESPKSAWLQFKIANRLLSLDDIEREG